jgi:hypothetical protein
LVIYLAKAAEVVTSVDVLHLQAALVTVQQPVALAIVPLAVVLVDELDKGHVVA